MFINRQRKELNLKVVYYGPPLSGKTTNLELIHPHAAPKSCGQLVSLKTHEDRTLFFDFMQLELGTVGGLRPKFNLYTVPGQAQYETTRKIVLRGADGAVFVADSRADRLRENLISWRQLQKHLQELRHDPAQFPIVVQYNKRDLPNALPVQLMGAVLGTDGRPVTEAVAIENDGVRDTLRVIIKLVLKQVVARPKVASATPVR